MEDTGMCGRFGLLAPSEIAERFALVAQLSFDARYNAAPTQAMPVVTQNGSRSLGLMRWGYEPRWLKEKGGGKPLINARADKLQSAPTFRDALRSQRAIVPATHFFEWHREGNRKTPYVFRLRGGALFGFAGLWFDEGGERRFLIITTEPNEVTSPVHNRMPAMLLPEHEDAWLAPDQGEPSRLMTLLGPYPAHLMDAFPVSSRVNSPANDTPDLLEPVPAQEATASVGSAGPNSA
jgi:putative SOS response-associated peptidase YedK